MSHDPGDPALDLTEPAVAALDPTEPAVAALGWTIVLPLKRVPNAKSRLLDATPDAHAHAKLVRAIRADTLHAAGTVGRLVIVHDGPGSPDGPDDQLATDGLVDVDRPVELVQIVQQGPGLNQALREGAAYAAQLWPRDGIAALVGDLPALRASELADALAQAAGHARAFVPDSAGTGTTMLTARPGVDLVPRFGPDSARQHRIEAVELPAGAGLRLDVDTAQDLTAAIDLGVGVHTAAVLHRVTGTVRRGGTG